MKQKKLSFSVFLFALFYACTNSTPVETGKNGEGSITYKVTYPDSAVITQQGVSSAMLPSETNLFFKGPKASFVTSAMGVIEIVNLLDNDKKKFTSLLISSFGESYAFTESPEAVKEQENNPEYEIETTHEKKTIAGLECNKAIVNDLTNKKKFDIYYYNKIKVYLGNSPYKDFNYLLMDYQDTRFGLPMHVLAQKVDFSPIDSTMLSVHGDFKWVDKKTFVKLIMGFKNAPPTNTGF